MLRGMRDAFCMFVLACWLRQATPQQIIVLGADLVKRGIQLQDGDDSPMAVEIVTTRHNPDTLGCDQTARIQGQKWVA